MHHNLVGFILGVQSLIHYQQIINIIHYISNLKEKMYKVMFINAGEYLVRFRDAFNKSYSHNCNRRRLLIYSSNYQKARPNIRT